MYPDIEIYIKKPDPEEIVAWLQQALGETTYHGTVKTGLHHYSVQYQDKALPVMIFPKAAGKAYTSVWFDTPDTPWQDDLDCAKAAADFLKTEVRCTRGGWSESQDPDEWLKVTDQGVEEIIWKQ